MKAVIFILAQIQFAYFMVIDTSMRALVVEHEGA